MIPFKICGMKPGAGLAAFLAAALQPAGEKCAAR